MTRGQGGDLATGLLFAALGGGIVVHAQGLRSMPGTIVGSGLFPTVTGALMVVFGLALAGTALAGRGPAEGERPALTGARRFVFPLAVLAAVVATAVLMPTLGFVIAGTLFAAVVARLGGAGWIGSVVAGVVMSIALYVVFVYGLGVPLPRGLLG